MPASVTYGSPFQYVLLYLLTYTLCDLTPFKLPFSEPKRRTQVDIRRDAVGAGRLTLTPHRSAVALPLRESSGRPPSTAGIRKPSQSPA